VTGYPNVRVIETKSEPIRLYLSGPMSGYEEFNYPAFNAAAARLREAGYKVDNPAEIGNPSMDYTDLIRGDIRVILECEGMAVLEGWWSSRGANVEASVAGILGLPIRSVEEWLARKLIDG